MNAVFIILAVLLVVERSWKHFLVARFLRRPAREAMRDPGLVSILQPILSGDPTLPWCLEQNLRARSSWRREFVWLIDSTDLAARQICEELCARHPEQTIRVVSTPPPPDGCSPKMIKLIEGVERSAGEVICVLDDDTMLPDGGLESSLPYLEDNGVGLVFGLPYYVSFANVWSSLVACFVNRHALTTYVPYTFLVEPFTINGMFFAFRRSTYRAIGGFRGLEEWVADDFAVARRFRSHGWRLVQTPLRHALSTHVPGPGAYARLLQRWFIFPRETLLKGLRWRELAVVHGLALGSALGPLLFLAGAILRPSRELAALFALYLLHDYAVFAHLNAAFLRRATPWRWSWLVVVVDLLLPLQILAALFAPQRIHWRGHVMQIARGGSFRFVKRRAEQTGLPRQGGER